jgi:hypothetical protein
VSSPDCDDFARDAVRLYSNFDLWKQSIENGTGIIKKRMLKPQQFRIIIGSIGEILPELEAQRKANHYRSLAWQETLAGLERRSRAIYQKKVLG